jgi:thiaminase/transcriptional activator TenA
MTGFTAAATDATAELRRAIHALPFNRALADGSLPAETFRFYIVQDSLYLADYARALAAAAAKAPDAAALTTFAGSAQGAIAVERELHARYFADFGLDPEAAAAAEPSPACLGYTGYLLGLAQTAGFAETVAGILPCFTVYDEVGRAIDAEAAADNPYRAWIDTYADPAFGEAVAEVAAIADRTAATAGPDTVAAMHRAFLRSTRFEWLFWDTAWRREGWPV